MSLGASSGASRSTHSRSALSTSRHRVDMKGRGSRMRCTWRLAGFLLVLGAALGAHAEPPSFKLPGRKPDSTEPWGAFLGRAAHFAIGRQYRVQHPINAVFLDTVNLSTLVKDGRLGDPKRLSKFVRHLRPDITDTDDLVLFEILAHARARSDALPLELPAQAVPCFLEGACGPEGRGVAQERRRAAR